MNQPTEWYYAWVYMIRDEDELIYFGTGHTILPARPTRNNLKSLSDTLAVSLKKELEDIPGELILTITGATPIYGPEQDTKIGLVTEANLANQFFSGVR